MSVWMQINDWLGAIFRDEENLSLLLLLIAGGLVVIFLGAMLAPFFAAFICTFLLQFLVSVLVKMRLPRNLAVYLSFCVFLGIMLILPLLLVLLWRQLNNLVGSLPQILVDMQALLNDLPKLYPAIISASQVEAWTLFMDEKINEAGPWILENSLQLIPDLIGLMIYLILVPILVFFMLKDKEQLLSYFNSLLPRRRARLARIAREMNVQAGNYVRGKTLELVIVGFVSYVVFALLGLNYAVLLAVLVGLSVLLPIVGVLLAAIPVVVVAFLQWGWSAEFAWVIGAYVIIQTIDANILVPLLFANTVNIHPISIVLAILVFGGIWGFWGLFFAIPMATLIKAVVNAWSTPQEVAIQEKADSQSAV